MDDNLIAALAIFCIFGLPILGWIVVRAFRFIERIEMIKRGMVPPPEGLGRRWPGGQQSAPGPAAGWQTQQPYAGTPTRQPAAPVFAPDDDAQSALFKGIRLALIGLALVIGLSFIGRGPWLLGGLVPMFVGVAQIIVALLSGAQLPGAQRVTFVPPPAGGPPPGPPPSAGAWEQPRAVRFEELSKPVQPPDLR